MIIPYNNDHGSEQIKQNAYVHELVSAWQQFLDRNNWHDLIDGYPPIVNGCGKVYDLPNFLNRSNECFAIVDMRDIGWAEPHYHPDNDIEIYFILQGTGLVVIGKQERRVHAGDVIVIPPYLAHFTIPDKEYVIAVVNTPSYKPENYIVLKESNQAVAFDRAQFQRLVGDNRGINEIT